MTLYAIAVILPDEIGKELDRLRNEFSKNMVYIPIPHLTLVYPFTPTIDITALIDKLKQVAETAAPFILTLNGIGYFEGKNNVAYVAVANIKPVINLHRKIIFSLAGLLKDELKDEQGNFNLDRFVHHVTIGELIPDEILAELKRHMSKNITHYETEVTSFSLFVRNEDGRWMTDNRFALAA